LHRTFTKARCAAIEEELSVKQQTIQQLEADLSAAQDEASKLLSFQDEQMQQIQLLQHQHEPIAGDEKQQKQQQIQQPQQAVDQKIAARKLAHCERKLEAQIFKTVQADNAVAREKAMVKTLRENLGTLRRQLAETRSASGHSTTTLHAELRAEQQRAQAAETQIEQAQKRIAEQRRAFARYRKQTIRSLVLFAALVTIASATVAFAIV
jgi:chromosome segregation ATPase